MDAKIQELTSRVYQEGVQKGEAERTRIVAEAREEAARIIAEAKREAGSIVEDATTKANKLQQQTEAELRLYAERLSAACKHSIEESITGDICSESVSAVVSDPTFVREFLLRVASRFSPEEGVVIETADAEGLQAFFASKAKALLDAGIQIREVSGQATQFAVAPADGSYKVQFGQAEFVELLKSYIRPGLSKLLFA